MVTDQEFQLRWQLETVKNLVAMVEGNPWETHLKRHLVPVQCELERQLKCELTRQTEEVRSTDRFA
jgi:hypothetical protein